MISAAIDAHRLDVAGPLTLDFLQASAPCYLTDVERVNANPDWFAGALVYACTLVKGTARPLQNVPHPTGMGALPGVVRLTDFLQQHGRRSRHILCPPTSFWDAAMAHMSDPADLNRLARAAKLRCRYRHSAQLFCASVEAGNTRATAELALLRMKTGDREGAERLLKNAAEAGNTRALTTLARLWDKAGDKEGAERLLKNATETGDPLVLMHLSRLREEAGDREGSEQLLKKAAKAGTAEVLTEVVWLWEEAGFGKAVEQFTLQALDTESTLIKQLARLLEETRGQEKAEQFAYQVLKDGDPFVLTTLAQFREESGDHEGAEQLLKNAAESGNTRG
uniref:tetratricopeptide repeat protein n=1 Tax=Nocardiopsis listeri TaxID=53440 RepID=UPI000B0A657C